MLPLCFFTTATRSFLNCWVSMGVVMSMQNPVRMSSEMFPRSVTLRNLKAYGEVLPCARSSGLTMNFSFTSPSKNSVACGVM